MEVGPEVRGRQILLCRVCSPLHLAGRGLYLSPVLSRVPFLVHDPYPSRSARSLSFSRSRASRGSFAAGLAAAAAAAALPSFSLKKKTTRNRKSVSIYIQKGVKERGEEEEAKPGSAGSCGVACHHPELG